ncbi:MAG: hypothetical protein K5656_03270 [Lachnospiraceae bacterium]|nr:hypothetical protein [Lachnospiraceae bacterium]
MKKTISLIMTMVLILSTVSLIPAKAASKKVKKYVTTSYEYVDGEWVLSNIWKEEYNKKSEMTKQYFERYDNGVVTSKSYIYISMIRMVN